MTALLTVVLIVMWAPLVGWWSLWLLFALLALFPARPRAAAAKGGTGTYTVDVLIPAHNEEILLPVLLEALRLQTAHQRMGHVLVIADHCNDRTASLARQHHAEVFERNAEPRGKPAALRDGLAYLNALNALSREAAHPRAVLILDADCTASPNLVEQCGLALDRGAAVLQAAYILDEPRRTKTSASRRLHSPAQIAFALKNLIRPKGMSHLGIPSQLFGTGMCFRAEVIAGLHFADHLTEDLALSYDLLLQGTPPQFLPAALVRSPLPEARSAMSTQKLRWETGQLLTWTKLPAIFGRLLSRGWLRSAVAVIDWSAPPLAMAVIFWLGLAFASLTFVLLRWSSPWLLAFPVVSMTCLAAYVLIGGMEISGVAAIARLMLGLPRFFLWKLSLYGQLLAGHAPRTWQRTPRSSGTREPLSSSAVVVQEVVRSK